MNGWAGKGARCMLAALLAVGLNPALAQRAHAVEPGTVTAAALTTSAAASVGGQEYDTLQAAVEAASGGTVTLLNDVDLGSACVTVAKDSSVTVDLAGKTIKSTSQVFDNAGTLIVKDGAGGGKLDSGFIGIRALEGSDTTFEGGTIESVESAIATLNQGEGARIVVTGGTLNCSDNAVLRTNGTRGSGKNVIVVTGGEFNGKITSSGYVACGIYVANDDTVTVTGGTFNVTGGAGIVARAGEVSVSGNARFETTGSVTGKVGDSRVVVPSAALVFDSDANYPGKTDSSRISVTGGSFKSEVAPVATVGEKSRISISGGSFSAAPDAEHVESGCLAAVNSGADAATHPSVVRRSVAAPSAVSGLAWTGSALTGVRAGAGYTVSGGSAVAVGGHVATATLASGYVWSDKTTAAKRVPWSIGRAAVAVPVARSGLVWNGSAQTGVAAGAGYTVAGGSATAAGSYTATVTPDANHRWADGSVSAKGVLWTIAKAAPGLSKSLKKTCKAKKLKKKAVKFTAHSVATDGKATWKVVKKSKRLKFNAGKVTVKKGTKKGAYKMKVRLAAAEGANRTALAAKTYTVKVRVK